MTELAIGVQLRETSGSADGMGLSAWIGDSCIGGLVVYVEGGEVRASLNLRGEDGVWRALPMEVGRA